MADERDVQTRNKELLDADLTDINKDCRWGYANLRYQKQLMGFDTIKDAREQFQNGSELYNRLAQRICISHGLSKRNH